MEEKKELNEPMSVEEFKEKIHQHALKRQEEIINDFENGILHLRFYDGVKKFKSIRRAIRRGHIYLDGIIFPKRPFNNKANTCKRKKHHSRTINERKKMIYEQLKHRKSA